MELQFFCSTNFFFLLSVTVRENKNPDVFLEDPKAVIEEPVHRPEVPWTDEDAQAITVWEKKRQTGKRQIFALKWRKKGTRAQNRSQWVYNKIQKLLASRFFLALGT